MILDGKNLLAKTKRTYLIDKVEKLKTTYAGYHV